MQSAPSNTTASVELDLSRTLLDGLRTPLSALRASMESLCQEYGERDPRSRVAKAALEEVLRLGRSVQDYAEWSTVPSARPLSCRPEEIAYSARFHLDAPQRGRVIVARERELPVLWIDGPLLARSLWRLLSLSLDSSSGETLLHIDREDDCVRFSITGSLPRLQGGELGPNEALRRELAKRDSVCAGGTLRWERRDKGDLRVRLLLPVRSPQA